MDIDKGVENIVKRMCEAMGVKNQNQLSIALELHSNSVIAGWKKRERVPMSWLKTVSKQSGKNLVWLMTGEESDSEGKNEQNGAKAAREIVGISVEDMSERTKTPISEKIKFIREDSGLTQAEFGECLNVAQKVVSNWESGRNEPSLGGIRAMCDTFQVSPTWLIFDTYRAEGFKDDIDMAYLEAKELAFGNEQMAALFEMIESFNEKYMTVEVLKGQLKTDGTKRFLVSLNDVLTLNGVDFSKFIDNLAKDVAKEVMIGEGMVIAIGDTIERHLVENKIYVESEERLMEQIRNSFSDTEAVDLLLMFKSKMERQNRA